MPYICLCVHVLGRIFGDLTILRNEISAIDEEPIFKAKYIEQRL